MDIWLIIHSFRPLKQGDALREVDSLKTSEQRPRPKRTTERDAKKSPAVC